MFGGRFRCSTWSVEMHRKQRARVKPPVADYSIRFEIYQLYECTLKDATIKLKNLQRCNNKTHVP